MKEASGRQSVLARFCQIPVTCKYQSFEKLLFGFYFHLAIGSMVVGSVMLVSLQDVLAS